MTRRWAFIGTGRVSRQMADAVGRTEGARLHGVLSRRPETARAFARDHGASLTYASLEVMLADPEVDIVYVASPNGLHREHVVAAAEAGKHVLCEKPMANDAADCRAMIAACARAGVQLGTGFQYRQHPAHRRVRELVASEQLGRSVVADAAVHVPPLATPDWYDDPSMAGGGVLPMAGVHRIDLLRFVLGAEVAEVSAFLGARDARRPYEDVVAAVLRFDGGALATVRFALDAAFSGDGVTVSGERGWASAARTTSQWWGTDGGELSWSGSHGTGAESYAVQDLYVSQVTSFSAAVAGEGQFEADGVDGLRAAEVTTALRRSAETGSVVPVERAPVGP
jgi:1,5-anhydro-D-fructose reductase (1,5-anhydro-D-mannitol-forming)